MYMVSRIRAVKRERERERERGKKNRGIEKGKETARCATRRAINVNHLADAQFNKKGHYDRELEVTSNEIFLSRLFIYSKMCELPTIPSKKIQFVAYA